MKINNKKIIVSTLALAMGAALAGSISGSVAWYQYSTRASAQIVGTSAGTEGRLQIKKYSDADTAYSHSIKIEGATFKPLSVKNTAGALTFYDHPVYQYAQLEEATAGYVDYDFSFRFQKNETDTPDAWTDVTTKNIYLSYFAIEPKTGDDDVTPAVRVAFLDSTGKAKFILGSSTTAVTTSTKEKLDMNKNGVDDKSGWDCLDTSGTDIEYTTGAASYDTNAHADVLADVSNPYDVDKAANSTKILSTTAADNKLTVRVWIEGFAQLNSKVIWDRDYIDQTFNINMQFQCNADR